VADGNDAIENLKIQVNDANHDLKKRENHN
jgi:hypothetical protein